MILFTCKFKNKNRATSWKLFDLEEELQIVDEIDRNFAEKIESYQFSTTECTFLQAK